MKRLYIFGLISLFVLVGCQVVTEDLPVAEPIVIPTKVEIAEVLPTETVPTTKTPTSIPDSPEPAVEPTAVAMMTEPPEPTMTPIPQPTETPLPGTELFTFSAGEPGWYTVDDDVMGGVSDSAVTVVESNQLYFSGTMSLDNNGGFSSVRSDWQLTDLSGNDGVLLRVKGDGLVYRLRIRTQSAGREISYNALFQTAADEWQVIYVPFAEMVPTFRGFVMDVGPLDPATVGSFGFMLSDKQPGTFALLVDWIRPVSAEEMQAFSSESG